MGSRVRSKSRGLWYVAIHWMALSSLIAADNEVRLVDAVQARDHKAVRSLLEQHVDVNEAQADGATALHWAAHWDDLETAEILIRAGANAEVANDYGITPLSLACTNRNAAMVERLLQAGADPNASQESGETVLMTCARTGNVKAVKLLLAHGADVNAKENRRNQTALMWAVAQKHADVVDTLIAYGADVNATSEMSFSPSGVEFETYSKVFNAPNRSRGGFTPLMFAARVGDLDSARLLIDAGANLDETAPEHGSALVVASASGHEDVAVLLLEKGADPNAADDYGLTALHYAVPEGISAFGAPTRFFLPNRPNLVKALLARGADPNTRATKTFEFNARPDFSLGRSIVGATPFLLAAASTDPNIMHILAEGGADPLLTTEEQITPLIALAEFVPSAIEQLISRKRSGPVEEQDRLDSAALAVQLGIDVNGADKDGQTALHTAASRGENKLIEFLVANGADLEAKNKVGQTPLSIAEDPKNVNYAAHDLKSTAKLLRTLGATQ